MQSKCKQCGAPISLDEIGATKKLINRGSTEFMCIKCLAEKYSVSEERILEKIEYWRESGCLLFAKKDERE